MRYRIKAYCKTSDVDPDTGLAPVYLTLSAPKVREILIATGKSISPKFFDNRVGATSGRTLPASQLQEYLNNEIAKLQSVIRDLEYHDETPDRARFKTRLPIPKPSCPEL